MRSPDLEFSVVTFPEQIDPELLRSPRLLVICLGRVPTCHFCFSLCRGRNVLRLHAANQSKQVIQCSDRRFFVSAYERSVNSCFLAGAVRDLFAPGGTDEKTGEVLISTNSGVVPSPSGFSSGVEMLSLS